MQNRFYDRYCKVIGSNNCECIGSGRVLFSEADTFIEFCFERKCAEMKNGMDMLDEWRYHKNQYSRIIETTIYDFQHYSRHDASHSVNILEVIELIIGEKGIALMSRGDLWLLLEAAYSHDIGMAMTGNELYELWKQEDFKAFLIDSLGRNGTDAQTAAAYYKQMDNLLHGKLQMDGLEVTRTESFEFPNYWPAEISNRVQWLVTEYIRKQHAMRNAKMRERIVTLKETIVPKRLYERVVVIANLHVMEYRDIFDRLPYQEKGVGAEWIHPQFIAAMLRIGDVLDTDNNRFSVYALEHMVEIPYTSKNHFLKHEAISQIQISEEEIYVSAVSCNRDACKEASNWFESIDHEVKNIIQNWNNIAPEHLQGCRLKPSHCEVFWENEEGQKLRYYADRDKFFEVNKQELIQLLIGTNIYDTELDFIREYLQNALDASKVQLWQDILSDEYEDILVNIKNEKLLMPFQIPNEIYDKYKVKIRIEIKPEDPNNVYILIEDYGIGMEGECIKVISSLGTGWRKREKYSRQIAQMPVWLRPTGGFGIGIQSAFMMTKEVEIFTRAQGESLGRKITLESPRFGGKIITEEIAKARRGTLVRTRVPVSKLLSWNQLEKKDAKIRWPEIGFNGDAGDIFSAEYMENYIVDVLKEYIKVIIPNSLIPISIGARGLQSVVVQRTLWENCIGKRWNEIEWKGKHFWWCEDGEHILIWDSDKKNLVSIQWQKDIPKETRANFAYYKNIRMTHEYATREKIYDNFNIWIDYMGVQARDVLKVHRNQFAEHFEYEKYIDEYIGLYLHLIILAEQKEIKLDVKPWRRQKEFLLTCFLLTKDERDFNYITQLIADLSNNTPEQYSLEKKHIKWQKEVEEEKSENVTDYKITLSINEIEKCTLWDFCQDYLRVKNCEKGGQLLVQIEKGDGVGSPIKETAIINWLKENVIFHENDDAHEYSDNVVREDLIYRVLEEGVYTGLSSFGAMMKNSNGFEVKYSILNVKDKENDKIGIMELSVKEESYNKKCIEKEFYLKSYDEKQYIFGQNNFPDKYSGLAVEKIPYNLKKSVMGKAPYLISPIIDKVKNKYGRLSILMMKERVMTSENEFVEDVMNTNEFECLVSWVASNAETAEYKNNKVQIRKLYEVYIRDIFRNSELEKHAKKR